MYGCESWTIKKAERPKNWCFWIVVLEKTLESPLDCKEMKQVNPKGNQPWIFIGRTDAEAEAPILWSPDMRSWLIGKDPEAGKDWKQKEKGLAEDEMVRQHHWLNSVQFSRSVMSNSLQPHEPQHTRPPCPSPAPGVYPNSCPLSRWCHSPISSSVVPFSPCLQSFLMSGSFQMSQLFTSGSQNTGVLASTSILAMNTQDWFPLGWTGWISLHWLNGHEF